MKVTYLPGPATRSGEVVQILEMQDDEEGVLVEWGWHHYKYPVKWINNNLWFYENNKWKDGWTRRSIEGFTKPHTYKVRIT